MSANKKKKIVIGILAHVDAGKTTLSEAMLYTGGSIRKLGRVDNKDAFLDTYVLERNRGITIFSKQAVFEYGTMSVTLLDTPGHVDFSAEMERTLQVLDYAVLVISAADGVQGHTLTLWRLLRKYRIPVFLFINKMDQNGTDKVALLKELKSRLQDSCLEFLAESTQEFYENAAMSDENALNYFLEQGKLEEEEIKRLILERKIFPCFFGSALKTEGVALLLAGMERYTKEPSYPEEFGAKVFKVARDEQGSRLTYLKVTGGSLKTKALLHGRDRNGDWEEKVNQIRIYSGERFTAVDEAAAGEVCAVTGLDRTYPGEGLGTEGDSFAPILEPVLTYSIRLPEGCDAAAMLPKLRKLEEEIPELHIVWEEASAQIQAKIMGEVQTEILKCLIKDRFGVEVDFGEGNIVYKETIARTVEGVGHFEPLRHYAEVHLLLEPGERGSGLVFESACSEDVLNKNWQRLILTHLQEKEHKGVLTGSVITDMRIILMTGRAHQKHTEGGDFRQATYRAVRQGLMEAEAVLLEPCYAFRLEIPEKLIGRAMTDLDKMQGTFSVSEAAGETAVLTGTAPVAAMQNYAKEVTAYTKGQGSLFCELSGYEPCHNTEEIIERLGYDAERDISNPTGSVFCAHGAGFVVDWDEVKNYMHVESCFADAGQEEQVQLSSNRPAKNTDAWIGTDEVDAIIERTFHANRREQGNPHKWSKIRRSFSGSVPQGEPETTRIYEKKEPKEEYLLVDGYNVIFAWEDLRELASVNIDSARGKLMDVLCNYQGIKGCHLILVFDAYRLQGHETEISDYHNIHVVYTKEAETADQYIEKFAYANADRYRVTVATSDGLEQIIIRGKGCGLISARELEIEIKSAGQRLNEEYRERQPKGKNYLFDGLLPEQAEEIKRQMKGE